MDLINRAYIDVMTTGDAWAACSPSHPHLQHHRDFPWESENAQLLF